MICLILLIAKVRHEIKLYENGTKRMRKDRNEKWPGKSDLEVMRGIFHWVFRIQKWAEDDIQNRIDRWIGVPQRPFAAFHIRWGDKIGRRAGPVEGVFIPLQLFVDTLNCRLPNWKTLFVASDDQAAIDEIRSLVGKGKDVRTFPASYGGFSIVEYVGRTDDTLQLLTEMSLMADADLFLGNMQSSIFQTVHLMRGDKPADSSVNMYSLHSKQPTCCTPDKVHINCFWVCQKIGNGG